MKLSDHAASSLHTVCSIRAVAATFVTLRTSMGTTQICAELLSKDICSLGVLILADWSFGHLE